MDNDAEGSNYENQFYSLKGDVDDLIKTLRLVETNVVDKGDGYALGMNDEYQVGYIDGLKNLQSILTDTADKLKEIRNREAQIVNDTDMSSAQKKAELDELRVSKNEMLYGIPELRKEYIQEIKPEAVVR